MTRGHVEGTRWGVREWACALSWLKRPDPSNLRRIGPVRAPGPSPGKHAGSSHLRV